MFWPFSPHSLVVYKHVEILSSLPEQLHEFEWATIRYNWGHFLFEGAATNTYPAEPTYQSICNFIDQWEDSWPLANSFFLADPSLIIQAIVHGTAIMVSNSSYKALLSTNIGAAAWIFECSETCASCFGECSTLGTRYEVNFYRSEIQGYHAGLLGLLAFAIYHQIQGGLVDFYFDNDTGLNQLADSNLNVTMKLKHGDLIRAIHWIVHKLKVEHLIHIQFVKVKGHKTNFIPFSQLSHPKQLNKLMDTRTKSRVDQIFSAPNPTPPNKIQFEGLSCWIKDTKITSDPTKQIMQQIHYDTMKLFLARPDHFHMSTTGFDLVDWDAVEMAMNGT
jgi:hypothetical protein